MDNNNDKLIEAILFLRGETGISPSDLKQLIGSASTAECRKILRAFVKEYNTEEKGIEVIETNDNFSFSTKAELFEDLSKFVTTEKTKKLSTAAIETIGIIAYKQPITKSQVNDVRGVASEAVVNTLLLKGLIDEKGTLETPGRPVLYGISDKFYSYFRIGSLKELPALSDFDMAEGQGESFDLFSSQRGDE